MAYAITLLQMRTRARRKADAVSDAHVEDAMLTDECNDLISRIWKEVFAVDPDRVATSTTGSLTGAEEYSLPAGFMSLRRLDWVQSSSSTPIEPAPLLELDMTGDSGGCPYYRLIGGGQTGSSERLHIRPDPGTGTYRIWYCAVPPVLALDADALDCRFDEHRYIIAGLARFIAVRQETDHTAHEAEMVEALDHVRTLARRRDSGRAKQITDVRSQRMGWRNRLPDP